MDDLLQFSGNAQKVIVETATIQKGTFSDKEGKKRVVIDARYNRNGELLSKILPERVETYLYQDNEMICLHVAKHDKTPIFKVDHYYEDNKVVRKIRTNEIGVVDDEERFYYNTEGLLSKKESKTMTYEYLYKDGLLAEERWHSDTHLNQIIRYSYDKGELVLIAHFSGDEIPGRKIEFIRERAGFITEEIIYSASNLVVSHFKYEYITIYRNNWLKRVKYLLHTQNKRKEASEVQYRDFKFYQEVERSIEKPDYTTDDETSTINQAEDTFDQDGISPETIEDQLMENYQELEFDNGIYKGQVVEGEMHGAGDFIFNTGTRYTGFFKNNNMEGKGKLTYINGKVYEGTFVNNMLEGPGACKWENGDFYAGEFKSGKMHGKGCYIWENGNRFEGIFEDNRRTEQGILYKKSELDSDQPPTWVNELFQ